MGALSTAGFDSGAGLVAEPSSSSKSAGSRVFPGRAHATRPRPQCATGSAGAMLVPVAGASHHAHAASVGRNVATTGGLVVGTPISLADEGAGRWVFGGESATARHQGADRTPRGAPHRPTTTPPPSPPRERCVGVAPKRVAGSPGRAKLDAPTNTTHTNPEPSPPPPQPRVFVPDPHHRPTSWNPFRSAPNPSCTYQKVQFGICLSSAPGRTTWLRHVGGCSWPPSPRGSS